MNQQTPGSADADDQPLFRAEVVDRLRHPDLVGQLLATPRPSPKSVLRGVVSAFGEATRAGLPRARRTPPLRHFRQVEAADCGAACLATVLDSFGHEATVKDLRRELDSGRGGVSAGGILRVARAHGLVARGVRADTESFELLPRGAILHWNLGHFVVLEEIRGGAFYVVDPAIGPRRLSRDDFARSFTGVALLFDGERIGPPSKETSLRTHHWRHVLPLVKGHGLWRSIITAAVLGQLLVLSFPFLLLYVLDHVIALDARRPLVLVAVLVFPVFLTQLLVLAVRTVSLSWLRARIDYQLSLAVLNKMFSLPHDFLSRRTTGDLMLRVRSTAALRQVFSTTMLSGIIDGATAGALLIVVSLLDVRLALFACLVIALQLFALRLAWRHQRELAASGLESQAVSQGRLVEILTGIQTLKLAGAGPAAADSWAQLLAEETNWEVRRSIAAGVTEGLLQTLRLLTPIVLLVVGAAEVFAGRITTGTMVAAVSLASGLLVPVTAMMSTALQMTVVRGHLDRLNDVFDEESEAAAGSAPSQRGRALAAEGVSYVYSGTDLDVVRDVDLLVTGGTSVAIMGPSGSGKSTLAMLLAGVYTPTDGRVLLDDDDMSGIAPAALREHIGIVPQRPHFFRGTIRDNITLFRDVPTDEVRRAARLACIEDEILSRPMGYDSSVAERGESLSGGQLQRIGLARALLFHPSVLVLDEATSALDVDTEEAVVSNVLGLGVTTVFVTHRASLAAYTDQVLLLSNGRAVPSESPTP